MKDFNNISLEEFTKAFQVARKLINEQDVDFLKESQSNCRLIGELVSSMAMLIDNNLEEEYDASLQIYKVILTMYI